MNPVDFFFGFAAGAVVAVTAGGAASLARLVYDRSELARVWKELEAAKEANMAKEATSKRVAAIAAKILKQKDLFGPDILALAASCLTQREPKKKAAKKP